MLYDHDMPKFPWEEAHNTIVFIHNRVPHRELGKITLEEVFMGKNT